MSPRTLLASVCCLTFPLLALAQAQDSAPVPLHGEIQDGQYISPTGLFQMPIPVLAPLGGTVSDSANVVTFRDAFTTSITVAVFPLSQAQVDEYHTIGSKDFLVQFFTNIVLKDLLSTYPGAAAESNARFISKLDGGAVLVYTLLPGGSAFNSRIELFPGQDAIPVAKRGNLAFVHDKNVILISSELGERSTERSLYKLTPAEQDLVLRSRLVALADSMILKSPATAPAAANTAAPAK